MATQSELINGMCQQPLFSPKGGIEAALIAHQVNRIALA